MQLTDLKLSHMATHLLYAQVEVADIIILYT